MGFFCLFFSTLQLRVVFRGLKILRPFLQFGIFTLAFYVSLTRISDYKHHPGDVVAGALVGVFFASINLLVLVDLFNRPRTFKLESCEDLREGERTALAEGFDGVDGGGGDAIQVHTMQYHACNQHLVFIIQKCFTSRVTAGASLSRRPASGTTTTTANTNSRERREGRGRARGAAGPAARRRPRKKVFL